MDPSWPQRRAARPHVRRMAASLGATLTLLGLLAVAAGPASADEFEVAIFSRSAQHDADAYVDGFRLAVDQSPDVSHPAGVEGGDHLGAMDVVLVVAADSGNNPTFPQSATDFPPIVVAEGESPFVLQMMQTVRATESFLIVVSDSDDVANNVSPDSFVVGRSDLDELLDERDFASAFETAYGRMPSAAATRGYLAGRLVDLAIGATERDPSDRATMARALEDLLNRTPGSNAVQPEPVAATDTGPTEADPSSESGADPMLILTGATIVAVLLGGLVLRRFLT